MSPLMSTADPIAIANREQSAATRPTVNVWVTASAGSGKTKVLTERVLSLLLAGTRPEKILGLTFTKAAAAEMSNRIAARLAAWVTADDDQLTRELAPLVHGALDDFATAQHLKERARQLFAQVLDAPGGLQISTLHAFCQSLLRRFPLEARVAPHFTLLDERDSREALDDALEQTVGMARDGADPDLAAALHLLTARVHETNFSDLMSALVAAGSKLKRMIEAHGDVAHATRAVHRKLGLEPGETEAAIIAPACRDDAFAGEGLRHAAAAMAGGSKTDQERGAGISAWLAAPAARAASFEAYAKNFLTERDEIRNSLATKKILALPGVAESLQAEAARVLAVIMRIKAARVAAGTAALLRIGDHVLKRYEDDKERRGALDYDDLIQLTRHLLARDGIAAWVLYKLDGGIEHILIDEAQDTNPDQWDIVAPIRAEFFSGQGRHEEHAVTPRTVFAVGDRKQSIYSFQGAAPEAFDHVHAETRTQVHDAGALWSDVTMNVSFRSTPAVLGCVNAVFQQPLARDGVAAPDEDITHLPARQNDAGLVEVWPLIEPQTGDETPSWKPPVERRGSDSPPNRLAAEIAARIRRMIDTGEMLESKGRAIRPGDIMVLVRRRTGFVEELVRQLKRREVAVAGVDRMVLTDQIAIMDLMALGQFLLLPQDDLTLATVLKGPLVGLTEDELFILAHNRGPKHLWDVLSIHAGTATPFGAAHKLLADLLARTDFLTPAALYGHILVALGGRRKLLARLGIDADDPIDEFMNLAIAYQQNHAPSLQGFLHWLAAGDIEIKRDLDQGGGDAVRVITVHGSKGLEAPIVFLPDTAQVPTMRNQLLWTDDKTPLLLWCSRTKDLDPISTNFREAAKNAQDREYHRLLYVAMTRAADRLYVCGWKTKRPVKLEESWYTLIKSGLEALPQTERDGEILRLSSQQTGDIKASGEVRAVENTAPLPAWMLAPPPPEESPARPLAPSRVLLPDPAALSPLKDDGKARYQRGIIIHRLLQGLPDIAPARRRAAATAFVQRPAWGLDAAMQEAIVAETLTVLDTPAFAPLFAAGSQAEVSVTGLIGGYAVSGQVDRLAVTAADVWIIDYKTNRPPPREAAKVDPAYIFQMATYRAALKAIYPERAVRSVLLWTDGPFVMELPSAAMDAILHKTGVI